MEKHRGRMGFAMIELALAVGIMAVLAGIGFAAEGVYARNLTKTEYDGLAKEIFVAAQNHLAMAASQNFMGMSTFGNPEKDKNGKDTGVYYFYVNPADYSKGLYKNTVLNVILPQYAIDEVLRARGHFFLRYHPDSAQVLDVFYWQDTGGRFSHTHKDEDYEAFRSDTSKNRLKDYPPEHSVIGYYGGFGDAASGIDVEKLTRGNELKDLSIAVTNGDKLTVNVTNPNAGNPNASNVIVQLIVTGQTSGETKIITVEFLPGTNETEVVLDAITTPEKHFSEVCPNLIPGEDIKIQAVAYSKEELTNVVYSSEQTTNSLFGDDTKNGTAEISNIRHLENLSTEVSKVNDPEDDKPNLITSAEQTSDLDWDKFPAEKGIYLPKSPDPATDGGKFLPINPEYPLAYDGGDHTISNIEVSGGTNGGLFGTLKDGSSVENLQLEDFQIDSGGNAGALVGTATNTTIDNVIAINKDKDDNSTPTIQGGGSTGGLIGSAEGCTVTNSAASVIVSSGGDAGGLIGTATDTTISSSYSGGHTKNGTYDSEHYNVTGGGNVGGLVGSTGGTNGTTIENSYSTSSAKSTGGADDSVGGLVGSASNTDITNSYATGLVDSSNTGNAGAVAGKVDDKTTFTDCTYYEIVNEKPKDGNPENGYEPLKAIGSGGSDENKPVPFDDEIGLYNEFVSGPDPNKNDAVPYDPKLTHDFKGDYPYKTVDDLTPDEPGGEEDPSGEDPDEKKTPSNVIHYGDWPSGETLVVNDT